jgi:bacteriocin-like protein
VITVTDRAEKRVEYGRGRKGRSDEESDMRKKPKSQRRDHLVQTTSEGVIELTEEELSRVTGGLKADGSLDAGLHFKYDIKGNKEG